MHQVRIHNFLERTKKKKVGKDQETGESVAVMKENEKLNKKVNNLMKKQKLQAVRRIVRGHDNSKSWTQEAKAKVCMVLFVYWLNIIILVFIRIQNGALSICASQVGSRLIELLTQTAFIQPPANQLGDGPLDIRPAFVHTFRTVSKDAKYLFAYLIDNSIRFSPLPNQF